MEIRYKDNTTYTPRRRLVRVLAKVLLPLFFGPFTIYTPGGELMPVLLRSADMVVPKAFDHVEGSVNGPSSFVELET